MQNAMVHLIGRTSDAWSSVAESMSKGFADAMCKLFDGARCEVFAEGKVPFDELPEEVKSVARSLIASHRECAVCFYDGKFHADADAFFASSRPADECRCGCYTQEDACA